MNNHRKSLKASSIECRDAKESHKKKRDYICGKLDGELPVRSFIVPGHCKNNLSDNCEIYFNYVSYFYITWQRKK